MLLLGRETVVPAKAQNLQHDFAGEAEVLRGISLRCSSLESLLCLLSSARALVGPPFRRSRIGLQVSSRHAVDYKNSFKHSKKHSETRERAAAVKGYEEYGDEATVVMTAEDNDL